jgi:hypothetical protein
MRAIAEQKKQEVLGMSVAIGLAFGGEEELQKFLKE